MCYQSNLRYLCKLALLYVALVLPASGAERRDEAFGEFGEYPANPGKPGNPANPENSDIERMDRFVIFNEKLRNAVCDENFAAKAPTLESLSTSDHRKIAGVSVAIGGGIAEQEVISFLLGDSIAGMYSEHMRQQLEADFARRGLSGGLRSLGPEILSEKLIEAQSAVIAAKRKVSREVCEGLVDHAKLLRLLGSKPSLFIHAVHSGSALGSVLRRPGFVVKVVDTSSRFALEPGARSERYLIGGWIEAFEIESVLVTGQGGEPIRTYRRISNPVTNNTQSIEVTDRAGVPLGILFVSHEVAAPEWGVYRKAAEHNDARARQLETYRLRIEIDAVRALQRQAPREKVRDLQIFYKNLLQAYQLFPNEKQFSAYSVRKGAAQSLDEVMRKTLGPQFLASLRQARVNDGFVNLGLFKPDLKLHAIYAEYASRLARLR